MEEERTFTSMEAIVRRKRKLHNEIAASERVIHHLWRDLFHRDRRKKKLSSTGRLTNIFSTSMTILDGAMFVWKVYRKFKR